MESAIVRSRSVSPYFSRWEGVGQDLLKDLPYGNVVGVRSRLRHRRRNHKPGNKFRNIPDVECAAWNLSGKRFRPPRVIEGEYGERRAARVGQEISTVHPHRLLSRWQVIRVALNLEMRTRSRGYVNQILSRLRRQKGQVQQVADRTACGSHRKPGRNDRIPISRGSVSRP